MIVLISQQFKTFKHIFKHVNNLYIYIIISNKEVAVNCSRHAIQPTTAQLAQLHTPFLYPNDPPPPPRPAPTQPTHPHTKRHIHLHRAQYNLTTLAHSAPQAQCKDPPLPLSFPHTLSPPTLLPSHPPHPTPPHPTPPHPTPPHTTPPHPTPHHTTPPHPSRPTHALTTLVEGQRPAGPSPFWVHCRVTVRCKIGGTTRYHTRQ